jgi:uncharacterized membrane protein YraQ (UPF0718 family)
MGRSRRPSVQAAQKSPTQNFLGGGGCGCGCFGLLIAMMGVGAMVAVYAEVFFEPMVTYAGGGGIVVGLIMACIGVLMYIGSFFVE